MDRRVLIKELDGPTCKTKPEVKKRGRHQYHHNNDPRVLWNKNGCRWIAICKAQGTHRI